MRFRYISASALVLTLVAGAPGLAAAQNAGAPATTAPAPGAPPAGAGNGVGPAGAGPAATGTAAPVNNGGGGSGGWWGLIGLIGLFGLMGGRRRGAPPATGIGPGAPIAGTGTVVGPDGRRDTTLPP